MTRFSRLLAPLPLYLLLLLLLPLLLLPAPLPAQDTTGGLEGFITQETQARLKAPAMVPPEHLTDDGRAALAASLEAYYRYHEGGFHHRRAVFDWQLLSSKIIFAVVILLVPVGVYFSWLQFMAGARGEPGPPDIPTAQADPQNHTTIEASVKGIKVTSPVLGVIILMISLAFFYLYLVHVYPISELF